MSVAITLSNGMHAIVDARDADLGLRRWYPSTMPNGATYATRSESKKTVYLHRLILKPPAGLDTDHENGDTLNNRRSNLRVATRSQNLANRKPRGVSGFKGVYRESRGNGWYAQVKVNRVKVYCKWFKTAEEAAHAYDKAAREHHGEFAWLNFPEGAV